MSEYVVVTDIDLDDEGCIVEALKDLGYPCKVHEEAQNLHGYAGDARKQKAHIIINRSDVGSASNDVGFLRDKNGKYKLIISKYDKGVHANSFLKKLPQRYAKAKLIKQASRLGIRIRSTVDANNEIHINAVVY